jgi:AsmA protein
MIRAFPTRPDRLVATPFRILLILVAIVLVFLGTIAAFVLTLDVESYREDIVRGVRESSGLDLRLDGPIDLTLWPNVTLNVEDARADWRDADDDPLATIRRMSLDVPLMPLLAGEGLTIESILVDGVTVDMRVAEDGTQNWVKEPDPDSDPDPEVDPEAVAEQATDAAADALAEVEEELQIDLEEGGTHADGTLELDLQRLEVVDLRVRYRDATTDTDIDLSGLDVVVIGTDGTLELDVDGRLDMVGGPHVAFEAEMVGDDDLARMEIRKVIADVELPGWQRALPIRLTGLARRGDSEETLVFEDMRLTAGELEARLSGEVDTGEAQTLALDFEIAPSDLRALLSRSGTAPATADPAALTELSGRVGIRGDSDDLRLDPIALRLDDLRLAGTARLRQGERTRADFDLDAGRLDLRPYLAPTAEAAPEPEGGPLVTDDPLELDVLADIDVLGSLTASALVLPNLEIGETRITVEGDRGRWDVDLDAASVLGGSVTVQTDLDVERDAPEFALRLDADAIDGGRLAPDAGFAGALSIDGRIDASGTSTAALADAARGRFDITGTPGVLDVAALRGALLPLAQLLGEADRVAAWPDQLRYESLTGAWVVADGTADQTLDLTLDNMRLDASGGVDLASGDFDFRSGALFSTTTPRTFDVPGDLDGVRLPARCTGRLGDEGSPCGFDRDATGELLQQIIAGRAGQQLRERLSDQIPEELRGPADALLRNLFGGGRQRQDPPPPTGDDP